MCICNLALLAQGGEPSRAIIRWSGQFHHQPGASDRTEHRAIIQMKGGGAVKDLPASLLIGPEQQPHHQPGVTSAGFTSSGGQGDQAPIGRELEHGIRIGLAHLRELLGAKLSFIRIKSGHASSEGGNRGLERSRPDSTCRSGSRSGQLADRAR